MSKVHDEFLEHAQEQLIELEAKQHEAAAVLASALIQSRQGTARPAIREMRKALADREAEIMSWRRVIDALPTAAKRDDDRDERLRKQYAELRAEKEEEERLREAEKAQREQQRIEHSLCVAAQRALEVFDSYDRSQLKFWLNPRTGESGHRKSMLDVLNAAPHLRLWDYRARCREALRLIDEATDESQEMSA